MGQSPDLIAPSTTPFDPVPLCVDLDGTIIEQDSLKVSLARLLVRRPFHVVPLALAVRRGRSWFKKRVADYFVPEPSHLRFRDDLCAFLKSEHALGRSIVMVTAADERIAQVVARHLGVFSTVIASDGETNCKGDAKVEAIRRVLGDGPFDFMGDSIHDLPALKLARKAYFVCPSPELHRRSGDCRVERIF